jgi:hypothetical protein
MKNDMKPGEVFVEILRVLYPKKFGGNLSAVHGVFYELRNKYPDIFAEFRFLKRVNPYCVTLDELIANFQRSGVLSQINPDDWIFKVDYRKLKEFPENNELFNIFKESEELQNMCV